MSKKKCLVFETLGKVSDLDIVKESNDGLIRLSGVFGVCGVKNQNQRVYNKQNYGMMVETLQNEIMTGSVLGELEHPNSMNINLENVSHKLESIEMHDDGTITGTIALLDTPKGRIAKAIAEAAGSLYISSRGAGSIDENGNVTLTTIKTYDLVGTPGFSQAKLNLKKGQKFESLCESLEDGNIMFAIVEDADEEKASDDKAGGDNTTNDKDKTSGNKTSDDKKSDDKQTDDNNKNNDNKEATMTEIKNAIDELSQKIDTLTADLHVAKESLIDKDKQIEELNEKLENATSVNYPAIEQWVKEEFAPEFKNGLHDEINATVSESANDLTKTIAEGVQKWVINEFAPIVEGYIVNEFAPVVESYITQEFAPVVEGWTTKELMPTVEKWITEEFGEHQQEKIRKYVNETFAESVEGWITEELMPTVEKWVNEECLPEHKNSIISEVNTNVSEFLESKNADKLSSIDNLLEAIENKGTDDAALQLLKEHKEDNKYKGIYVVESMPSQYRPQWEMCSENKKNEIIRQSRMYDFTKAGILEKFWDTVDFNETVIKESKTPENIENNYHNNIAAQMRRLMH